MVELCDTVRDGGAAVLVVAVEGLDGGRHAPLVSLLAEQPPWSDIPVVLVTTGGEGAQTVLRDHLAAGGSTTFLERPFRAVTLASIVRVGLRSRRRQYELRDIMADRERLLREAEHAGRMKDEFLATLSHELRTPLSAILGWAQLLSRGDRAVEEFREGLAVIARNARSQTQLIEDLLDMSRIVAGKVRLDVQLVSPATLLDGAVEALRPAAEAKHIRLVKVLDPAAGPVSGDPARLQQVVWNLMTNAIKFTPKGGKVHVRLGRVNSHVEISVADTGQGIGPGFLPHVFDRFRQADGSSTRRAGGLGIGLSIVRQLVELHGGTVRAESPGDGKGSTFTVDLPLAIVHVENSPAGLRVHPKAPSAAA
ncbi:MAG: rpfC [Phycisphaerales bacterium]|nr:rpfC [Phycisphaerales bacterium]